MQTVTKCATAGVASISDRDRSPSLLRVGMHGAGEQTTTRLLPILQRLANVEVVGLVDIDPLRLAATADRFQIPIRAATTQDLMEMVEFDAIVAACPPHAHYEIAVLALEQNIPIFVEKPPTLTTHDLHQLSTRAQVANVVTGVGMNFRWAEPVRRAVSLLTQPDIGPAVSVSVSHLANKPRSGLWGLDRLGGYLLAQAIHSIDLLLQLSGPLLSVSTVMTSASRPLRIEVQADTTMGGVASLSTGIHNGPMRSHIEVTTESGVTITVDDLTTLRVAGLDREQYHWTQQWRPSPLNDGSARTGYQPQLEAFADAALSGRPFQPSFVDLLPTYLTIDQIVDSTA